MQKQSQGKCCYDGLRRNLNQGLCQTQVSVWPVGLQNETLQLIFRLSALPCSPITISITRLQPALTAAKKWPHCYLKVSALAPEPWKDTFRQVQAGVEAEAEGSEDGEDPGTTLHSVLQTLDCKHSSRTQKSSLLKMTAYVQSWFKPNEQLSSEKARASASQDRLKI